MKRDHATAKPEMMTKNKKLGLKCVWIGINSKKSSGLKESGQLELGHTNYQKIVE